MMSEETPTQQANAPGDPAAASQLLPLVYAELRQLAAQRLAHETPGQTLQPTALVHEAYLRLVGASRNRTGIAGAFFRRRGRSALRPPERHQQGHAQGPMSGEVATSL